MSDIKTVTLDGGELKIEGLNGQNTEIINKSGGAVYASKSPGVVPEADGVIEIAANTRDGLHGTNGTLYLLGTGKVELRGTDYSIDIYQSSSQTMSNGGGDTPGENTMPYANALSNIFTIDNFDAAAQRWYNSARSNYVNTDNANLVEDSVHFNFNAYGIVNTDIPVIVYAVVRQGKKTAQDYSCMIAKELTTTGSEGAFDFDGHILNGQTSHPYLTGGIIADDYDLIDYNVYCFQRNGQNIELYVNGNMVGRTEKTDILDNYGGTYILNATRRGIAQYAISQNESYFKTVIFGYENHSEEQIKANCEWLMTKYL